MLTEVLASRGDWRRAKAVRKKAVAAADGVEEEKEELKLPRAFQLLLGTAQVRSLNSTVPSNHRRVKWAHLTRCRARASSSRSLATACGPRRS
jgi:hypothetical protein